MNRVGFIASSLLVVLALLSSMLFVVDQRQFGIIYALGQIKEVITEPGLNFKLPPPFQNVSYIDKRLLTLDSTDTEPMLTAEKQRVVIDPAPWSRRQLHAPHLWPCVGNGPLGCRCSDADQHRIG